MNVWATDHPGNMHFEADANPIKAIARRGETTLRFPASHDMSQFASGLPSFALLGKLGFAYERDLRLSGEQQDVRLFGRILE